jgi:hypothetical protein
MIFGDPFTTKEECEIACAARKQELQTTVNFIAVGVEQEQL